MDRQFQNRFVGKAAIVTGGAAGIGAAMVREFVSEGGAVMFSDLSPNGARMADELGAQGGRVAFAQGDMAVAPQHQRILTYPPLTPCGE